eukprot:2736844-Amphidinium_carterae.1
MIIIIIIIVIVIVIIIIIIIINHQQHHGVRFGMWQNAERAKQTVCFVPNCWPLFVRSQEPKKHMNIDY